MPIALPKYRTRVVRPAPALLTGFVALLRLDLDHLAVDDLDVRREVRPGQHPGEPVVVEPDLLSGLVGVQEEVGVSMEIQDTAVGQWTVLVEVLGY